MYFRCDRIISFVLVCGVCGLAIVSPAPAAGQQGWLFEVQIVQPPYPVILGEWIGDSVKIKGRVVNRTGKKHRIPKMIHDAAWFRLSAIITQPDKSQLSVQGSKRGIGLSEPNDFIDIEDGQEYSGMVTLGAFGYIVPEQAGAHTIEVSYQPVPGTTLKQKTTFHIYGAKKDILASSQRIDGEFKDEPIYVQKIRIGDKCHLYYRRFYKGNATLSIWLTEINAERNFVVARSKQALHVTYAHSDTGLTHLKWLGVDENGKSLIQKKTTDDE